METEKQELEDAEKFIAQLKKQLTTAMESNAELYKQNKKLSAEISEAWTITNSLTMRYLDDKESCPRALAWLEKNDKFNPNKCGMKDQIFNNSTRLHIKNLK